MNSHEKKIRRHANGSIDTGFYLKRCHEMRSRAAHDTIARTAAGSIRTIHDVVASWRGRGIG